MAEAKKVRFYLLDEDGKPTKGSVGIDGGVPGAGQYLDAKADGVIETSDPGVIAQLEGYAKSPSHPVSADPPKKES